MILNENLVKIHICNFGVNTLHRTSYLKKKWLNSSGFKRSLNFHVNQLKKQTTPYKKWPARSFFYLLKSFFFSLKGIDMLTKKKIAIIVE